MRANRRMFVNGDQIRLWHKEVRPHGRISVLKQVERKLALIVEVSKTGKQKIKTAKEIE